MSLPSGFIITSCSSIEGYKIKAHYGPVFGETVYKTSFFKSLGSGIKDFGNSLHVFSEREMSGITGLIRDAQQYALDKIKEEAKKKGANAVVGLDAESTIEDNGLLHVSMYGTAVKIEKLIDSSVDAVPSSLSEQTTDTQSVASLFCTETNYDDKFIVHQLVLYNGNIGKILIATNEDITGIKLHFEGTSVFDEKKTTATVEAVGFKKIQNFFYESSIFEISKDFYSLSTMKSLCAVIEKYVVDGHVYIEDSVELRPINKQTYVEGQIQSIVSVDGSANVGSSFLYVDPDSGSTASELYEKLKSEIPSPIDPACEYILHQLERIVSSEKRFSTNKKDVFLDTADKLRQNYYLYLANNTLIRINDDLVECPFCHTQQQARRIRCITCGIPLDNN